jgi:NAD(P)-dependent dehydrogenase (short-subunit alcohol dehydrogenase family)
MTRLIDLDGRAALVTGAGSGIGRACAEALAACGASLVVADRDVEAAGATVEGILTSGGSARAVQLDVTDWEQCQAIAEQCAGDVEILVNCAATWKVERFLDTDPIAWERDLAVTLGGTLAVTRAMLPGMVSREKGSIVSISSDAGRVGQRSQVLYSAAKAGVIGFTKSLALEVGRFGVRVNCVAPGLTRTAGSAAFIDAFGADRLRAQYPLGRIGEPSDIADAVLYFASDLSSWVTGQVLSVSGGYTTVG